MHNDHDHGKDITDAEGELDRLETAGEIMPEAVWLAQVSRVMYELGSAFYGRELKKIQRSKRLSKLQTPFLGLADVQHIVTVEAGGRVRLAFMHEAADPKILEWWRISGRDVAPLVDGVDRLIEVTYPLLGAESPSKLAAFQKLEADGAKRCLLLNLTRVYLDALVVTAKAEVCQVARFSNPLKGAPKPAMDLTQLH